MKKVLLALVSIGLSLQLVAAEFDLEPIMKGLRQAYSQAEKADSVEEMQTAVNRLGELVEQAKQGTYSPERDPVYQEGYNKLTASFASINSALEKGDLALAKQQLEQVDSLKKEYHKKAKELK